MPQLDQNRFIERARRLVVIAQNTNAPGTPLDIDDVYVVWFTKTLQNWKAMVSTDKVSGVYYEVTHNGDKQETYVDIYAKVANFAISDDTVIPPKYLRSV